MAFEIRVGAVTVKVTRQSKRERGIPHSKENVDGLWVRLQRAAQPETARAVKREGGCGSKTLKVTVVFFSQLTTTDLYSVSIK